MSEAATEFPFADVSGEPATGEEDSVAKKAVLLRLTIRSWGVRRTVPKAKVEVNADKKLIHVGKDIIDSPTHRKIRSFDGETRAILSAKALPSQFKSGVYLVGTKAVERIDAILQKRIVRREELVDQLAVELPELIRAVTPRLRELFVEPEYPTPEELRRLFSMTYSYFTFDTPASLKAISKEIFEREANNAREWWVEAKKNADALLVLQAQELVKHLQERLSADKVEGERVKGLRTTAIEGLREFFDEFTDRNLADNTKLAEIVDRGRKLIKGVDVDTLRNNLGAREVVLAGLGDIDTQLDKLIVEKPTRQFLSLEDEE